jgi:lysophospholipid acyltransferase (LPLAT)-like uncharacterized protein
MRDLLRARMKSTLRRIAPWFAFILHRSLLATWRVEFHESPAFQSARRNGEPIVFAHWHGDELGLVFLLPYYKSCAMVSTSEDGSIMAKVVELYGAKVSRGSSTRGGVSALRGLLRLARDGWSPSVAVDGPKGPRHRAKPGVVELAKLTGGRIYPLVADCDRGWVFRKSWNQAYLPKPGARVCIHVGDPLPLLNKDVDAHDVGLAQSLEAALTNAKRHARSLIECPADSVS